ncbi:MAG: cupin domain-containing protein, partial [Deltaproteobacteria bacterium]|nr:cupin domain-containing protein [Deltaproteobacteria bacterium]
HVHAKDKEWEKTYGPGAAVSEKKLLTASDTPIASVTIRKITVTGDLEGGGYHPHSHPNTEIVYVIRGKVESHIEGIGNIEINEGDLLMVEGGIVHGGKVCSEEVEAISIQIPAEK